MHKIRIKDTEFYLNHTVSRNFGCRLQPVVMMMKYVGQNTYVGEDFSER